MDAFEEKYLDVLQNIEFALVSVYRENDEMTDWEALRAVEALIRAYQAEERGRPTPELNLKPLAEKAADRVRTFCEWRLGRRALKQDKTGESIQIQSEAKTVAEIIACLKRVRRSIENWQKRGGGAGISTSSASSCLEGKGKDKAETLAQNLMDPEPVGQKPTPVHRKVLAVIYDPRIPSAGGRNLSQVMRWNNPDELSAQYLADVREASHGYANFEVVVRIEVDRFPVKMDGFAYTAETYLRCLRAGAGFHQPDAVDYHRILSDFDILEKIERAAIDEVWLFAFPYAGFYESIMCGPGAFWCNAPELKETDRAGRRFVIMGFNYERGVGEMLEDLGHRAESILARVFRDEKGSENLWEKFARHEKTHPGRSEAGNVHFAPNSERDCDWGNKKKVKSRYHTWRNFPDLDGEAQVVDSQHWGNGDIRSHHLWWFSLFPHITGSMHGIKHNWWEYVIDPNTVK